MPGELNAARAEGLRHAPLPRPQPAQVPPSGNAPTATSPCSSKPTRTTTNPASAPCAPSCPGTSTNSSTAATSPAALPASAATTAATNTCPPSRAKAAGSAPPATRKTKRCQKGVSPEWRLDKVQQNELFLNGFSDSRSVSAGVAVNWLQNQVFSPVEVRHTAEHGGTGEFLTGLQVTFVQR